MYPLDKRGHFNSNYFMSLIPNETSLEYTVVPGNYAVATIALGAALLPGTRPLSLTTSPEMLRSGSRKVLRTLTASG